MAKNVTAETEVMDYKIATGRLVDKIVTTYRGYLIEKVSFKDGLRYTVRLGPLGKPSLDLHIVNKLNKVFIEFWPLNHATPLLVLERDLSNNIDELYRDIASILSMLWSVKKRKRSRLVLRRS
ncbi:MAG: hypothetical protein GXO10_02485 [Crenarchaeota archaeon]|nr:hypothetical protein [Thermoproteota archaeon]